MSDHEIAVSCTQSADGWLCRVAVGTDAQATTHDVVVHRRTRDELAPGAEPEALVRESFVFLLEREPRESILRSFELPVIARYFSEYTTEIARRLRAGS